MTKRWLGLLAEEESPEEILQKVLTVSEEDNLRNIKYELGLCVKWGELTEQMFMALLEGMDELVFKETEDGEPQVVKRNPYDALFPKDKALINSSTEKSILARKYVLTLLLKKLLGSIKTRVNKELKAIEVIDLETEIELKDLLVEEPDEEEMDLVGGKKTTEDGREIIAEIDLAEDRGCEHLRVTLRQVQADVSKSGLDEIHSYCRECRQEIRVDILKGKKINRRKSKGALKTFLSQEKICLHKEVQWKKGLEGKVAECSKCQKEVDKPEIYLWEKVGLEPFGDDPSEDEVIVIPARKQEVAV